LIVDVDMNLLKRITWAWKCEYNER
jgi:hypothetical protein